MLISIIPFRLPLFQCCSLWLNFSRDWCLISGSYGTYIFFLLVLLYLVYIVHRRRSYDLGLRQIAWSWIETGLRAMSVSELRVHHCVVRIVVLYFMRCSRLIWACQLLDRADLIRYSWSQWIWRCDTKGALRRLKIFHTTVRDHCSWETMREWPWMVVWSYLSRDLFKFGFSDSKTLCKVLER